MDNPNYYAILPANVRYDKNLRPMEKIMYAEITALTNMNGKCTAGNQYFADLYGVTKGAVSKWVTHLKKLGYIDIEITYKTDSSIDERIITLPAHREHTPMRKKDHTPIRQKDQVNINNTTYYKNNITKRESTPTPTEPKKKTKRFEKPDLADVQNYMRIKDIEHYEDESEKFMDTYDACGWVVGKTCKPMKDWKAAIRNWKKNVKNFNKPDHNGKGDPFAWRNKT